VVHHHRVRPVNVWVWATPPIIFVVVVGFDFTECFVDDELAGVFDVIGVVYNDWFDVVPVPLLSIKSVSFITDASGFETAVLQVVATPRVDI